MKCVDKLSRGKVCRSINNTLCPERASSMAVGAPATPEPITTTSNDSMVSSLSVRADRRVTEPCISVSRLGCQHIPDPWLSRDRSFCRHSCTLFALLYVAAKLKAVFQQWHAGLILRGAACLHFGDDGSHAVAAQGAIKSQLKVFKRCSRATLFNSGRAGDPGQVGPRPRGGWESACRKQALVIENHMNEISGRIPGK